MLTNSWPLLLNNLFNRDSFNEGNLDFYDKKNSTISPAVNIKETPQSFAIEILAAGLSKKDFKIEVNGNELIISAEKSKADESYKEENYHRKEFSFQSIKRTFTLPENIVDVDKIRAEYDNGVLLLEIPKKEEALPKPAKLIEIA